MKYLRLFEGFDDPDVIVVMDPSGFDRVERTVYKDIQIAQKKLEEIKSKIEKGKVYSYHGTSEIEKVLRLVFDTAKFESFKLREKYKSDKNLTDFEKNAMGYKFKWDNESLRQDPNYKLSSRLMNDCRMIWEPTTRKEDLESLDKMADDLHNDIITRQKETGEGNEWERTNKPDHLKFLDYGPGDIKDLNDTDWNSIKNLSEGDINRLRQSVINSIVDRLYDEKAYKTEEGKEILNKYSKKFESLHNYQKRIKLHEKFRYKTTHTK